MTRTDIWCAIRDAAASLAPVLKQGAIEIGTLTATQLWGSRTGGSVGEFRVDPTDWPLGEKSFRQFCEDAAYAGWSDKCPQHGNVADDSGVCSPCGCEI